MMYKPQIAQIAQIFKSRRKKRKDSFGVCQAQQNFCDFFYFCGIVYSLCCYDFTEHEDTKKGRAAHRAKKLCVFVSLCSIKF